MSRKILFLVEGKPVPKPRMTQSDSWKKRPEVIRYRKYVDAVRAAIIDKKRELGIPGDEIFEGPVAVDMVFSPLATLVVVRELEGPMPKKRGDLDNLTKSLCEGLSAQKGGIESLVPILIKDDRQVVRLTARFNE